jgi:hypothetical protein
LSPLIAAQGRDGRCLPTTLLLQRFLDGEGVWNFPQKGGVVVRFPTESKLPPKIFEPLDGETGTFGHAWNIAPPFVIDLTIAKQFYTSAQETHISGFVLLVRNTATEAKPAFSEHGLPSARIRELFPPFSVRLDQCLISYYPYGTGGPVEKFSEVKEPLLNGLRPFDLYRIFSQRKAI